MKLVLGGAESTGGSPSVSVWSWGRATRGVVFGWSTGVSFDGRAIVSVGLGMEVESGTRGDGGVSSIACIEFWGPPGGPDVSS